MTTEREAAPSSTRSPNTKQDPSPESHVQPLSWAAAQLSIGLSTAYRLAETKRLPGAFKIGAQWRISVPKFLREVHGTEAA